MNIIEGKKLQTMKLSWFQESRHTASHKLVSITYRQNYVDEYILTITARNFNFESSSFDITPTSKEFKIEIHRYSQKEKFNNLNR
jgi:hypothetical protein